MGYDTTSTYSNSQETIKIINKTHFAFFTHDLHQGKKADSIFVAGGGTYTLIGDNNTEHLVYCKFREWENKDFYFKIVLRGDTLTQIGMEKVEKLSINRKIIKKYVAWQKLKF
ncbi:hypothetical protein ABIB40_002886 [Pedobacter sp. UYP30]|uniref:hypothetical protein n=1 Tax=Pedobacter sp. UYP30 TaxID=1756400 RepID=UPI003390813C